MGKKVLTNIRPREVSLVDKAANKKEFLMVKNENGEMVEVEKKEGEDSGKDENLTKKFEIAPHTINFSKYMFEKKEDCIKELMSNGVENPETLEMVETDWEWKFVVNAKEMFEGTSLASYHYIPMAQGVDSLVAVMKRQIEDEVIEKKGAKISQARLNKIKDAAQKLQDIIKELDGDMETEKKDDNVSKQENIEKNDEVKTDEVKVDETKVEETPVEKTDEVKTDEPKAEMSAEQVEEIAKRVASEEIKKRDEKIESLEKKNEELQKNLDELKGTPVEKRSADADSTDQPVNKSESIWKGIL